MKLKKLFTYAVALALILCTMPLTSVKSSALSWKNFEYEIDGLEVTITSYSDSASGDVEIPDRVSGLLPVTGIASSAFYCCDEITSVTIPKTVNYIESGAFYGCTALTEINVADDNEYYCDIDGVLFDKDGEILSYYPEGRKGSYTIPDSVIFYVIHIFGNGVYSVLRLRTGNQVGAAFIE